MTDYVTLKLKRGIASDWATRNPILSEGEPGYELDTGKLKIGNGITGWNGLPYLSSGGSIGAQGPTGPPGLNINIRGSTYAVPPGGTGNVNDAWIDETDLNLYVWTGTSWTNVGQIVGTPGAPGARGPTGSVGNNGSVGPTGPPGLNINIRGSTYAVPPGGTGNVNDAWIDETDLNLYVWTGTSWTNVGQIVGTPGAPGSRGPTGPTGPGSGGGFTLPPLVFAGGYSGNILDYSQDGISWNASTNGSILTRCNTIATNGQMWIAGGYTRSTPISSTTESLAYSYDGITWTGVGFPLMFTTMCNSVIWTGTHWVAGGSGNNSIATSSDGISWSSVVTEGSTVLRSCNSLSNIGTLVVAGGIFGTGGAIAYSTNGGTTWTQSSNGSFTNACTVIGTDGTMFVAGSNGSTSLLHSTNGNNWTATSGRLLANNAIAYDGSTWLLVGNETGSSPSKNLCTSSDGLTWTTVDTIGVAGLNSNILKSVTYTGSIWVVGIDLQNGGSSTANTCWYSSDLITWTPCGLSRAGGTLALTTGTNPWNTPYPTSLNAAINRIANVLSNNLSIKL